MCGDRLSAGVTMGLATSRTAADDQICGASDAVCKEAAVAVHDVYVGPGVGIQTIVQIGYIYIESVPHNDSDAGKWSE